MKIATTCNILVTQSRNFPPMKITMFSVVKMTTRGTDRPHVTIKHRPHKNLFAPILEKEGITDF